MISTMEFFPSENMSDADNSTNPKYSTLPVMQIIYFLLVFSSELKHAFPKLEEALLKDLKARLILFHIDNKSFPIGRCLNMIITKCREQINVGAAIV